MPAWATVVLTLGTTALAVAGTLLAPLISDRLTRARREREAHEERVREGANVVAPVTLLLLDADPIPLGVNLKRDDPYGRLNELTSEWRALRPPLAAYSLAHPSPDVREMGRALDVAVSRSLSSTAWMLAGLSGSSSIAASESHHEAAKRDHTEARTAVERFLALVREPPWASLGPSGEPRPAEIERAAAEAKTSDQRGKR